ncbi:MAG TPA: hypothetical protein VJR92_03575 [Gemmatimonadaceae bacterium]|nr:hypothetical protein [Gemmatimonadaceae bacterium]
MKTRWIVPALLCTLLCASLASCDSSTSPDNAIPEIQDPPAGFLKFVAIDAGGGTVCGITADSLTYCWGMPLVGVQYEYAPKWISSVPKLGTISVGTHHDADANAMLCGHNPSNEVVCYGQSGWPSQMVTVPGSAGFTNVSVGEAICALTSDGYARCWRYKSPSGRMGIGDESSTIAGTPYAVAGDRQYSSLSTGWVSSCATTSAGEMYCWGNNFALQVSSDPEFFGRLPQPVPMPAPATTVSTLELHTCALVSGAQAGTYCWGMHARGRLGQIDPTTVECPGVIDGNTAQPARCVAQPIKVSGDVSFVALAAGTHHTCGLDAQGQAFCWGSGTWGELGNGRNGVSNWKATPTPVAGNLRFRAIAAGQFFTCGIATNDATYCWGSNFGGMLGASQSGGFVSTVPYPIALPQSN